MAWLKKYLPEIIVFGLIFSVLLICVAPDITWVNTDSDGPHYVLAAKYMVPAHNTSAPLFLLTGRAFLFLPFGTDAWKMGLISVIATTLCAYVIYLIVKNKLKDNPKSRLFALISALIYGGSALVISQSTIIESYAMATLFAITAYYFYSQSKYNWTSVFLGLCLAVHPLFAVITWFVLFLANKSMRKWKPIIITSSFVLFYLYIPVVARLTVEYDMWGNASIGGFLGNNLTTMLMLAGNISLWDLPKRILDTIAMLGVSLGLSFIPLIYYFVKQRTWKNSLLWLFSLPVIYFIVNLSMETYVYMMIGIAFAAIPIGIGLSKMNIKWAYAVGVVAVGLTLFNAHYFDIGRTLDPNLSAARYYQEELPKLDDGDILLAGGWTWAIAYLYNKEEGRQIEPVCIDILPSEQYMQDLEDAGIKLIRTDSDRHIDKQWEVALSIAELNDNVWLAKETNPASYEYELVLAKDNMWLIERWLNYEKEPEWRFDVSNPYHFITGALAVEEWKFIVWTNHSVFFYIQWATAGLFIYWIGVMIYDKKKKQRNISENRVEGQVKG